MDQTESIPEIYCFSSNNTSTYYEENSECAAGFPKENLLEDSTSISESANDSMRVDTIQNQGESCQIINCNSSNDISECPNSENLIRKISSDNISTVLSKGTLREVRPVQNTGTCSILSFLEQSIRARLDERAYLIKKISDIITNLPFHLQLKPAGH